MYVHSYGFFLQGKNHLREELETSSVVAGEGFDNRKQSTIEQKNVIQK